MICKRKTAKTSKLPVSWSIALPSSTEEKSHRAEYSKNNANACYNGLRQRHSPAFLQDNRTGGSLLGCRHSKIGNNAMTHAVLYPDLPLPRTIGIEGETPPSIRPAILMLHLAVCRAKNHYLGKGHRLSGGVIKLNRNRLITG